MSQSKIKQIILLNLPYAFLFWLFNKLSEAIRAAPGNDIGQKLMNGINNINSAFANPLPSFDLTNLCVGLIGAAGCFGIVWSKKKNAKKWRKDVVRYKGRQWITAYNQSGQYVCGTNGRRNLKGAYNYGNILRAGRRLSPA